MDEKRYVVMCIRLHNPNLLVNTLIKMFKSLCEKTKLLSIFVNDIVRNVQI